ncbi:MAG: pyridoxine 5'-phosphate synthase [Candidatus Omnitrophica bacterium]|nr:pyridoxine 5'-phosphate synthase [Candidatus Omnitrophota bacterium]
MQKKLGVNIDHVATLRQARGGEIPNLCQAACEAVQGGAEGITVHLREDRRHIQDHDLSDLKRILRVPLNLEMALHWDIIRIALKVRPEKVCIVPEKRQELTTEGGLDATLKFHKLKEIIPEFRSKKVEVSLFIDPDLKQVETAATLRVPAIEIHTGSYADATGSRKKKELERIRQASREAASLGLKVHAGHGINYKNIKPLKKISEISEFNIGYSIICRAVFVGLRQAVLEMREKIEEKS